MRAWAGLLADAAAGRPVVLALHPGTAAALEAAGIAHDRPCASSRRRATGRR